MTLRGQIDLGLGLLDHQLVDSEGIRCGKADDLELDGLHDGRPRVAAVLTGPSALAHRGVVGRLWAAIWDGRMVHVPWEEVDDVGAGLFLRRTAEELHLAVGDRRARKIVDRVPGAHR